MPNQPTVTNTEWALAFLAVAEQGSFTRAAEYLGSSKALLSKQLAQLEATLKVQLLYRTTRRLSLTEAGRIYLHYCLQLRNTLNEAELAVSSMRQEVSGLLRITAPTTFGAVFMADLLRAFKAQYPAIQVEVDLSLDFRDLEAGGFDLAIRSSPSQNDRLIAKPVGVRRDWLVASPQLVQQTGEPRQPLQFQQLPCIVNSHFRDARRWIFMRNDLATPVEVQSWLSANDYPLIRQLCLNHMGFACLPRYQIESDVLAGRLQRVMADYELPYFPIYLVYPYRQPQPAKVRALIDFASDWFAQPEQALVKW